MRKLVIFVTAFSLSTLLSVYLLPTLIVVIGACIFAVAAVGFVFLSGKARSRYFISCLGLAFGFIWFFVHSALFTFPAQKLENTSQKISATVISYPSNNSVNVKIELEDSFDIRASLYCSEGFPDNTAPGDTITTNAEFRETYNDYKYDSGIKLYAYSSNITLQKGSGGIRFFAAYAAHYIKGIIEEIFPENTFAFATALITGDKTDFYDDMLLDSHFKAAGLSHIVAVSGMHLSFVLAIPGMLVKNRRRFSLVSIPCILFFMAFAGFTPSVCRAGIMHLCVAAASLFHREPDDYTSLFTAVFLILLCDPYSAASISLQLSFASVLGIMMFSSRICNALSKPAEKLPKVFRYIYHAFINVFSTSIGALIFTAPLSALYFGQISIVSPVVSIFVLGVLSLTFCLCIVSCVLGMIFLPAGVFAASFSSLLLRYIMWVAQTSADSTISSIYTSNITAVIWLVLTYLVFIVVFIMKRPPRAYIIPICLSIIGLCLMLIIPKIPSSDMSLNMTVLDVGQGQCIVLTTSNMTAVIDCGSNSEEDAGEIAADYLHSQGIDSIDLLILTHYHSDHVNGVTYLMSAINVNTLIIPPLESYTTYDDEIVSIAEAADSQIVYIENDMIADMGDTKLNIYQPVFPSGENERCAAVLCSNKNYDILVTGDMPAYCELLLMEHADLPDIEVLIAGHHGSAGSSCDALLTALKPETAIISTGYNNYGHPSDETLLRFAEYGIIVFRTDRLGHITLD